jgi:hypothetical protein
MQSPPALLRVSPRIRRPRSCPSRRAWDPLAVVALNVRRPSRAMPYPQSPPAVLHAEPPAELRVEARNRGRPPRIAAGQTASRGQGTVAALHAEPPANLRAGARNRDRPPRRAAGRTAHRGRGIVAAVRTARRGRGTAAALHAEPPSELRAGAGNRGRLHAEPPATLALAAIHNFL